MDLAKWLIVVNKKSLQGFFDGLLAMKERLFQQRRAGAKQLFRAGHIFAGKAQPLPGLIELE
jgi:hypothetical protein